MSNEQIKEKKRILDALKKGNIPNADVTPLCVGMDKELKLFDEILESVSEDDEAITKFIQGEFGTGKSFLLKVLEEKAFKENFVVSKITLSNDIRMNKIEVFYKAITKNLKCKTGIGLKKIIERWYNKLNNRANLSEDISIKERNKIIEESVRDDLEDCRQYANAFANATEGYIKSLRQEDYDTADDAIAWLSGDFNVPFNRKRKFGVKGDVEKENALNYLKGLSAFIKSIGYSGLVILVDEAEYTLNINNRTYRDVAYNYIRDIYDGCSDGEYDSTLFIFAATLDFYEDSRKGVRSYSALYNRIQPNFEDMDDIRRPIIQLKGFNHQDLIKIGDNIIKMHEEVYKWNSKSLINLEAVLDSEEEEATLTNGLVVPRSYLRLLVDYLDVVQQNPDKADLALDKIKKEEFYDEDIEDW